MLTFGFLLSAIYLAQSAAATTFQANAGCILVAGTIALCAPNTVSIHGGATTIYARFDSGNKSPEAVPGCKLNAAWPSYYGNVFFGADNCLYDADSQNIDGQCCRAGTGGSKPVPNPYAPHRDEVAEEAGELV
ncbi:hypothetical protein FB451DRAFT_1399734 [Mycena latifolia]|nr:hypothetical protein FB451DRAFT_1399734 [Mycena latifolia]